MLLQQEPSLPLPSLYAPPGLLFPTAERSRTRHLRREANNLQALPQKGEKKVHTHTHRQVKTHSISEPSEVTAGKNHVDAHHGYFISRPFLFYIFFHWGIFL